MSTPKAGSRTVPIMATFTANTNANRAHPRAASADLRHVMATRPQKTAWLTSTISHGGIDGPEPPMRAFMNEAGTTARNHAVAKYSRYGRAPPTAEPLARPEATKTARKRTAAAPTASHRMRSSHSPLIPRGTSRSAGRTTRRKKSRYAGISRNLTWNAPAAATATTATPIQYVDLGST